MNKKTMKSKYEAMADLAAITALNTLEAEGEYTPETSEVLWETAWETAFAAYVCNDACHEEGVYLATQAARRHALAIYGGVARREHIKAGKITPSWLLAQ